MLKRPLRALLLGALVSILFPQPAGGQWTACKRCGSYDEMRFCTATFSVEAGWSECREYVRCVDGYCYQYCALEYSCYLI